MEVRWQALLRATFVSSGHRNSSWALYFQVAFLLTCVPILVLLCQ